MSHLISPVLSCLGLLPYRYVILWTLVILAFFNSTQDTKQEWGTYHYYMGAKYFSELGYFELYECSITLPDQRRDLETYNFRFGYPDCDAKFELKRQVEFHNDLVTIGFDDRFLVDKGFNATPTWIFIGQALINSGLATPDNLYLFDLLALLICIPVLIWSVGWERAGLICLFILTFYGTQDRLWGHFAQWLWLACILSGVSLLHKKHSWGAIWIGLSASLAIFPVFLMLMYLRNKRALIWAFLGLGIGLFIGLGNSRGLNAYPEFVEKMSLHSSYVRTELCCNVGLAHTITWTLNPDSEYLAECFATADDCQTSYQPRFNALFWQAIVPLVLTSPLGAMFGLLTLSIYYYLILAVIPIWYGARWGRCLLLVNGIILVWMLFDFHGATVYRHWLWFIFLMVIGVKEHHVIQILSSALLATQQRLHPQATTRDVSQSL